jgi:hypothetical protein
MLYSDDVVIVDDGDLNLEGGVTPVRSEDNFSVNFIPQRSVRVVQENDQMLFTDSMQVDGDLIVDGDILDATPYDGNDILAALTAIAPLTPSILGVASPASFLTPLQARTVMDVPSNAEMNAAIAANPTGLTFTATLYNAAFTAELNKINRVDGSTSYTTVIPDTGLVDGDRVAFYTPNGAVPEILTLNFGTKTLYGLIPTFPIPVQVIGSGAVSEVTVLTYSANEDYWVVSGGLDQLFLTQTPYLIAVSDADSQKVNLQLSSDTLLGRLSGNISPLTGSDVLTILYPGQTVVDANVGTGSNTPTTIYTYPTTTDNTVITLDLLVQAKSNANTDVAVFKLVGVCHRAGGAATVTSKDLTFVNGPYRDAGAVAWNVTFLISGGGPNIEVQVTGDIGESISWRVTGVVSTQS